jgi:DNA-binding NarL/FixJ family response regulator
MKRPQATPGASIPSARDLCISDFDEALSVSQEGCWIDAHDKSRIIALLTRLLSENRMFGVVITDAARLANRHIVGVGAGTFVSDEYIERVWSGQAPPYLLRALCDEKELPCLSPKEIFSTNHRDNGVNFLGLLYGDNPSQSANEADSTIRDTLFQTFQENLQGYYLKSWTKEVYGEVRLRIFTDGFGAKPRFMPVETHGEFSPFIMGATREESLDPACSGRPVRFIFNWQSPRVYYSLAERKVLQMGVDFKTQQDIADCLGITLRTVRAQLGSALRRTEQSALSGALSGTREGKAFLRGLEQSGDQQQNRSLFEFVSKFPEELRPHWRSARDIA